MREPWAVLDNPELNYMDWAITQLTVGSELCRKNNNNNNYIINGIFSSQCLSILKGDT